MTICRSGAGFPSETEICSREVSNILRSASRTYSPGRTLEIENWPAEFVVVLAFRGPTASRRVIFASTIEAPEESSTCPVMVTEFVAGCATAHALANTRHRHISVGERKITGEPAICFISHPGCWHLKRKVRHTCRTKSRFGRFKNLARNQKFSISHALELSVIAPIAK